MQGQDDFSDVRNSPELRSYGSLGGEGTGELDKVTESFAPDGSGMVFRVHCQFCGVPAAITVSWDEFIFGANKHIPVDPETRQPWTANPARGGFMPPIACACKRPVQIVITPQECQRHLRNGQDANRVSADYVRQRSVQLAQSAGRYQR